MVKFWSFQLKENVERYSTQMSKLDIVIVPVQHVSVRGTLLIKLVYKSRRIVQNSLQSYLQNSVQVFV